MLVGSVQSVKFAEQVIVQLSELLRANLHYTPGGVFRRGQIGQRVAVAVEADDVDGFFCSPR